ncbi:hypothetical protein [Hydrogenobaculum acidophilum]
MSKIFRVGKVMSKAILGIPTKKRTPAFNNTVNNSLGEWIISAQETINAFDFKVLAAFLTSLYDCRETFASKQDIQVLLSGEIDIQVVKEFYDMTFTFSIDLYKFATEYMLLSRNSIGGKTYKAILESLRRLKTLSIEGKIIDKKMNKETAFSMMPLPFIRITKDNSEKDGSKKYTLELTFFGALLMMFEHKEALYINNDYIQKTKSRTATFLVFFLMTQKNANSFSLSFLRKQLNMYTQEKNRTTLRDIRKAFNELVKISFLKSWHEEKRQNDTYFIFVRNKSDKKAIKSQNNHC